MGLGSARKTVLVTGAAGFLGSHLVDRLLAEGYAVIGLDNLMTGDLANLAAAERDPHFHFQLGDVREPIAAYAEMIFNLACPASPVHYQHDPHATMTSSVLGALRLAEYAKTRPSVKILHTSTSEVYGDPLEHPQKETYWGHVNPVGPRACYDEGKRAAETILVDSRADVRIVRIFNTYGPRMALNDGRVVSNFIRQALSGESVTIYGDGSQSRSFCYVDDLIEGIFRVSGLVTKVPLIVNLGNPIEITMLDLVKAVEAAYGHHVPVRELPLPIDDPRRRCPDITRARELIGFAPKTALAEGIRRTMDDFRRRTSAPSLGT